QPQRTIDTDVNRTIAVEVLAPPEPIVDVPVPEVDVAGETTQPVLYISIGGVGTRILSYLSDLRAQQAKVIEQAVPVELMAIDTDRQELKDACSMKWKNPLSSNDIVCTSLRLPQEYRDRNQLNLEWLSHRWLYNIPRSLETRGYRPLGRLALLDHIDEALALVDRKLAALAAVEGSSADKSEPSVIRAMLLAGMGGGTGGGMAIDVANAVRSRIHKLGRQARIECVLVCTCVGNPSATPLSVANTYALLKELQVASAFGNCGPQGALKDVRPFESSDRPFDTIYCVRAKQQAEGSVDEGLRAIAEQLTVAATDGVRQPLTSCRQTTEKEPAGRDSFLLRTFGSSSLIGRERKRIERLAKQAALMIEQYWLSDVRPTEWKRLETEAGPAAPSADPAANSAPSGGDAAPVAAAGISRVLTEDLRHRFGERASTRFAYEAVSRIARQSALRGAYRSTLLSFQDPNKFVSAASEVLSSICVRIAAAPKDNDPLAAEDAAIVDKLLLNSHRILASCIDEIEQLPADKPLDAAKINRMVESECLAGVEQCIVRQSNGGKEALAASPQSEADEALDRAKVDLLQCGYNRHTLIVVPFRVKSNAKSSEAIDALTTARSTAAVVVAAVDEPVVYCEGSGISPTSFARGLERVYPGIAEAASRRYTRTDIDWSTWPA
ncbi:MAG TPA: tubulin-like doman-containing protein, partial [Pirellulales bacterium]|nr:tubulin-like doman-containing protein [Pirellulales bacterium]